MSFYIGWGIVAIVAIWIVGLALSSPGPYPRR
jgi:hypothetical protein